MSFQEECRQHRPWLLSYAKFLTNGDTETAEDVVQNALLKGWRHWKKFIRHHDLSARNWLFSIVKSEFLNQYKLNKVRARKYDEYELPVQEPVVTEPFGDEILNAMKGLPVAQQEVVRRFCIDGQSYREIAGCMGTSIGTVMSRMYRGRHGIRARMAEAV